MDTCRARLKYLCDDFPCWDWPLWTTERDYAVYDPYTDIHNSVESTVHTAEEAAGNGKPIS